MSLIEKLESCHFQGGANLAEPEGNENTRRALVVILNEIIDCVNIIGVSGGISRQIFEIHQGIPATLARYFWEGEVNLICVPWIIESDAEIFAATVRVNKVDTDRAFDIEILVNGSVVQTLDFTAGSLDKTFSFSENVSAGDEIQLRMSRSSGTSGSSTFQDVLLTLGFRS